MRRNEKGLFIFAIGCLLAVCMDEAAKRAKREELDEVPFEEENEYVEDEIYETIEPEEEPVEPEVEEFEPTPEEIEAAEAILEELLEELEEEEIHEDNEE